MQKVAILPVGNRHLVKHGLCCLEANLGGGRAPVPAISLVHCAGCPDLTLKVVLGSSFGLATACRILVPRPGM